MPLIFNLYPVIFLFNGLALNQAPNPLPESQITWVKDQPLTWNDFEGTPDNSTHLHAYTRTSLKTDFLSNTSNSAVLAVSGYFDKSESWVKPDQKTDRLLVHEQRHFDMSEIYRRKLMQKLESFEGFSFKNFSKEASRIFNEIFQELTSEQKRYDQETQHSKIEDKQKAWGEYIDKELEKMKAYEGLEITVKVN
jgi:hypothetical protein